MLLLLIIQELYTKFKIIFNYFNTFFSYVIFIFPSIFLKQSNRSFLNNLAINNLELFEGSGGGNYIKEVYKRLFIGLDDDEILEKFNIVYSEKDKKTILRMQHKKKLTS